MQLSCSYGEYEQAGLAHIRETFAKMVEALGAEIVHISEPVSHHHPMGMTRMGADPKTSVVDAQCRSHDHQNLFVLSSSVFPTGGTVSPTLTIAALSLRAADEVMVQLRQEGASFG